MTDLSIKITLNGQALTREWIESKELERTHHVVQEMADLGAEFTYKGQPISPEDLLALPFESAKEALIETKLTLGKDSILRLYESKLVESDEMWRTIVANTVKGRNLQPAYVEVDVDGLTLGDFLAFNQSLNKMTDPALPFKIHPEHFVFAGVHGGQEVMEMVGQYGEPTYQKLFIHPGAEKPTALDDDTKMAMAGDGVLMSDQTVDMKMYGMHQFKMKKGGLRIKLGVFFPETAPEEMILGHQEHLAVEFYNSLTFAHRTKSFKGRVLNTILKFKKFD
ncbi:hypothetical protein [uncultured Actinomyces sp.]|jgi:hypothetical protein|uniref:hypothetical protein n=1 Tax=uncultured Actinomyces sp. TaxID=249061 RepID=UPI0028D3C4BB|nr:hypothetical protein [uncultured Actinomyces sp.]